MKALIKKGTEENPIWGFIRFDAKCWSFVSGWQKPILFNSDFTLESIRGLCKDDPALNDYELVDVEIKVKSKNS